MSKKKTWKDQVTTVYMQCIYSVGKVYTEVCSVSAVYEQPILQVHCIGCSVAAVYTAWHCRYTVHCLALQVHSTSIWVLGIKTAYHSVEESLICYKRSLYFQYSIYNPTFSAKDLGREWLRYIGNCACGWDARIFTIFWGQIWSYLRSALTDSDNLLVKSNSRQGQGWGIP